MTIFSFNEVGTSHSKDLKDVGEKNVAEVGVQSNRSTMMEVKDPGFAQIARRKDLIL